MMLMRFQLKEIDSGLSLKIPKLCHITGSDTRVQDYSVLRNKPHLVPPNWPLMENFSVEPDSRRKHLQPRLMVINS